MVANEIRNPETAPFKRPTSTASAPKVPLLAGLEPVRTLWTSPAHPPTISRYPLGFHLNSLSCRSADDLLKVTKKGRFIWTQSVSRSSLPLFINKKRTPAEPIYPAVKREDRAIQ
ncbi:hypothetical protein DPEC_G00063100 [Dallia pectoralis]|uniref:Uncharacterized protein n=1 Tax=Dallia pectoralis TaxID=75939 RepID=A0ACC2H8C7_DALPE|nr:hypothetical protein DPEC_G00063100 [Dallia pectoralis]